MVLIGILSIGFLGGCLGAKPEDQLYVAFENAANQEKALFDNVKTFEQLETKEQELYNQIIQEGKEQNEGVIQKIEQAIATVNEREKLLKDEKDVLEKAQKETASVHSYIDKIEDKKLKNQAEKVEEVYKNRYEVFQKINNSYKEELIAEKELYEKLKGKETKLKEIGEKVKTINTLNEETLKEKKNSINILKSIMRKN